MKLNVTIRRVCYPPPTDDGNWYILDTNQGICKGSMAWRPGIGDPLVLDGEWCVYRGQREFKFAGAMIDLPVSPEDQLHYVCTRTIGIGPALERAIWEFAGSDWMNIEPGSIPKLTDDKFERLRIQIDLLESEKEKSDAIAVLMGKGCTQTMAVAAWDKWEKETIGVVSNNCFQLAELPNYGFKNVDGEIRMNFGIEDNDPRRIKAAVIYSLRQLTSGGSTAILWQELMLKCTGFLGGFQDLIVEVTGELFEDGTLKGFPTSQRMSLGNDFRNESDIWNYINQ